MSVTSDSTLTNPEQRIADLERQLAECQAERDENQAQKEAMAEVLGVINSSPADLKPVFDAMLERATALCEAAFGTLATYDGERFAPAAEYGVPIAFATFRSERGAFAPPPGSSLERVVNGENLVHIADATADPDQAAAPLVQLGRCRSLVCVALRKDNRLVGAVTAYRQELRPFSEKQIALLQNFAAQAVIAMENARLITETHEALEQQTATAEVLQVINSSPSNLAPVFDAMLGRALQLCEAAFGLLNTWDGERWHHAARKGLSAELLEAIRWGEPFVSSPGSVADRLVRGEDTIYSADLVRDEAVRNVPYVQTMVRGGFRSSIAIALRKDAKLLGAIAIYRQEVRPFTDKQIALLQNFAAQTVIAMENARLLTETREALEQQTATAEVLGVINSSPGNLAPVFDAILEKAHSLCGVEYGTLQLYDGEKFRILTRRGFPQEVGQSWRDPYSVAPNSPLRALLEGQPLAEIPDVVAYQANTPNPRAEAAIAVGIRSVLFLPLRRDNLLLGVISAGRKAAKPFRAKEVALLQNFAAQAGIAMENARLLTETREALEQQTATAEVLQVINSSPGDLAPVFDAILEKAYRLCDVAHGSLYLRDGEIIRPVAPTHGSGVWRERLRKGAPVDDNPFVRPLLAGAPFLHVPDMAELDHPLARAIVETSGMHTGLYVPLRKDDTLLGLISAVRPEIRPFTDKQIALLQNFAEQAVIAIENARLLSELRQRTDEVAELNRGLEARVAEQVEELGRVGRLKRFLAPQLAELIVSQGDEKILESHRREIVVVFCDLRGYTAFTETAEPEEVLKFLREYHGALGPLVSQFEGTLDQFSGDGIMVFFNDPVPCRDPAERAVKMAMAMREEAGELIAAWRRHGCELGFGAGIAQGYATLGQIGFSERSGYTAIGTVCNLAARLCAEAKDGQILVSSHIAEAVEAVVRLEDLGNLELKGLRRPVAAFNVVQSTSAGDVRPNLTVVARGPGA